MDINITRVCQYVAQVCDDWNIGYSQPGRWNLHPGGSTDCSALAAAAYNNGGANPPFPRDSSTRNLRSYAGARDFTILSYGRGLTLQAGDALLSEAASGGVGHVAIYTGGNALREAWISEIGGIDGASGDQTGNETRTISYATHPYTLGGRWTHVLRPPTTTKPTTPTITGDPDMAFTNAHATKLDNMAWLFSNSLMPAVARLDQARVSEAAQLAALRAAVEALAKTQGVDPKIVTDTVDKAVREALAGLEVTLATKEWSDK